MTLIIIRIVPILIFFLFNIHYSYNLLQLSYNLFISLTYSYSSSFTIIHKKFINNKKIDTFPTIITIIVK